MALDSPHQLRLLVLKEHAAAIVHKHRHDLEAQRAQFHRLASRLGITLAQVQAALSEERHDSQEE